MFSPPRVNLSQCSVNPTGRFDFKALPFQNEAVFLDMHTECHTFCSDMAADECSTRSLLPRDGLLLTALRAWNANTPLESGNCARTVPVTRG